MRKFKVNKKTKEGKKQTKNQKATVSPAFYSTGNSQTSTVKLTVGSKSKSATQIVTVSPSFYPSSNSAKSPSITITSGSRNISPSFTGSITNVGDLSADPIRTITGYTPPYKADNTPAAESSIIGKSSKGLSSGEKMPEYKSYEEAADAAKKLGEETRKKKRQYERNYGWRDKPEDTAGYGLAKWELDKTREARDAALKYMRDHSSEAAPSQNIRVEGNAAGSIRQIEKWQDQRDEEASRPDPDVDKLKKLDQQLAAWKRAIGVENAAGQTDGSTIAERLSGLRGHTRNENTARIDMSKAFGAALNYQTTPVDEMTEINRPTLWDRVKNMGETAGYNMIGSYQQGTTTAYAALHSLDDNANLSSPAYWDFDTTGPTIAQWKTEYQNLLDSYLDQYGSMEVLPDFAKKNLDWYEGQIISYEESIEHQTHEPERRQEAIARGNAIANAYMQKSAQARNEAKEGLAPNQQRVIDKGISYFAALYNIPVSVLTGLPPKALNVAQAFGEKAYEAARNGGDAQAQIKAGMTGAGFTYLLNALLYRGVDISRARTSSESLVPAQPGSLTVSAPLYGEAARPAGEAVRDVLTVGAVQTALSRKQAQESDRTEMGEQDLQSILDIAKTSGIISLTEEQENLLAQYSFDRIQPLIGKLPNRAARKWYIYQDSQIPDKIDKSLSLEEQAHMACNLRIENRINARELMEDQVARKWLEENQPSKTFEQLINDKMEKYHLTREDAIKDVLQTATKTNKEINEKLGLEGN